MTDPRTEIADAEPHHTHVVLSWIWLPDGTASVQLLGFGSEKACAAHAATNPKQTDDPREEIIVRPRSQYEAGLETRAKEFH